MDALFSTCPICKYHNKDPIKVILHVSTEHTITSSILDGDDDEEEDDDDDDGWSDDDDSTLQSESELAPLPKPAKKSIKMPQLVEKTTSSRHVQTLPAPSQVHRTPTFSLPTQDNPFTPLVTQDATIVERDTSRELAETLRQELTKIQQTIDASTSEHPPMVTCLVCSQSIRLIDYNSHIMTHTQAAVPSLSSDADFSDDPSAPRTQNRGGRALPLTSSYSRSRQNRSYAQKASELGPFCHEQRMPDWLLRQHYQGPPKRKITQLDKNGKPVEKIVCETQHAGLIGRLAEVMPRCNETWKAYLCHPAVKHVHKQPYDGPFCGYFNIQMLISYLQTVHPEVRPVFRSSRGAIPTIIELQNMIENAWDRGFFPIGREETGGICGTRKWIGVPEVLALFSSKGLHVNCYRFKKRKGERRSAYEQLLDAVQKYFTGSVTPRGRRSKQVVKIANKAPLYLQHPGHSMTIVGIELRQHERNILVFNPGHGPPPRLRQIHYGGDKRKPSSASVDKILSVYRRPQLQLYDCFDIVSVSVPDKYRPKSLR